MLSSKRKILIIDDDVKICEILQTALQRLGYEVACRNNLKGGLDEADIRDYDVILLDICLPDGSGLSAVKEFGRNGPMPEIIIMTGEGGPDDAEAAIKNGVWDYIEKPLSMKSLAICLEHALQYRQQKYTENAVTRFDRGDIIGNSLLLRQRIDLAARAAESTVNVLITGETGTGKELFAAAVHNNSGRKCMNFVVVDCAALPETLVESVLFGHEKGAFTGADKARDGLVRQADGGTLFLDEVGELPLSIQKSFLRVLQERRFRPVGGKQEIGSDFRLIAATNRNLDGMVKNGKFRQDLLFRIRSSVIELPSLRDMKEDIELFTVHYIRKICERYELAVKNFASEFLETLAAYHWPGNVRELINTLENAISNARHETTLFPKHLSINVRVNVVRSSVRKNNTEPRPMSSETNFLSKLPTMKFFRETVMANHEKKYLHQLMSLTKGNMREACQISGLGRSRLYGLIKQYDL